MSDVEKKEQSQEKEATCQAPQDKEEEGVTCKLEKISPVEKDSEQDDVSEVETQEEEDASSSQDLLFVDTPHVCSTPLRNEVFDVNSLNNLGYDKLSQDSDSASDYSACADYNGSSESSEFDSEDSWSW